MADSALAFKLLLRFCHEPVSVPMVHYDAASALDHLSEAFPGFLEQVRGRQVIDFGCGLGYQVVALAKAGASRVIGVENEPALAMQAQARIQQGGCADMASVRPCLAGESADVIVSQNSFEHFAAPGEILAELKAALRPGGRIFLTFGPLWFTPAGSHMGFFCSVPWVNLLFPESAVMAARCRYRDDGARTYSEAGLAKMSLAKFERVVRHSGLQPRWTSYDCVRRLRAMQHVPLVRELFVNRVNCILTH